MKLTKIVWAVASITMASSAFAGTVTGSSNLDFVAFDGQKLKKKQTIQINDEKQHQVVFSVSSIYQSGSDNHFFESTPIVLTFQGSPENIQILAPHLRTKYEIEKFKENPTFKVQTTSGKQLDYKKDYLTGEGFMPNANISNNLATYNSGDGVAAVKQFASAPIMAMMLAQNGGATQGKVTVQGENIAEQQLQYWFQQADKETQKRFLNWAKKH